MMKILIVSTEFPPGPGGIGTHAFQIARGLYRRRHKIHVLTCQDYVSKKEILDFNQSCGFKVTTLPSGIGKFFRIFSLMSIYLRMKPDVILATGDSAFYLTAALRALFRFKFIGVEHGRIPSAEFERKMKRRACLKMDRVICVSAYTQKRAREAGLVSEASIVIHNGADDEIFKELPEREWKHLRPEDVEAKILVTVGNVTERKGQETVIRALPEILKLFPKVQYSIIGLPTLKQPLEELAKSLGVLEHIRFLGKVSERELVLRLNAADLFLMTSKHASAGDFEGFGIAVVEAALCGKPAIVSENSGLAEAVVSNKTGILVPESAEKEVAEAVKKLLSNNDLRAEMSRAAGNHARLNQTWKQSAEKYEKVLFEVVSEK